MSVFRDRLKLIMSERNMSQAELCRLTGIPKSAVNQYLSDRFQPRQGRTEIICRALDVNPAWLMGLDDVRCGFHEKGVSCILTEDEFTLISAYRGDPATRRKLRFIINKLETDNLAFRAAKSHDGKVAPTFEELSDERMRLLIKTPETDEDL